MRYRQGTAPVPSRVVDRIAAEADVAEETVRRLIYGKPVRPRIARRITVAMERRGLGGLVPGRQAGAARPKEIAPTAATAPAERLLPCAHLTRRYQDYRRKYRPDETGPRGIGMVPLTSSERQEMAEDEAAVLAAGVSLQRPRTLAECPPANEPCPWVSCRHHLYLEVDPEHGFIKLNFPERDIDELDETCSLRVAARTPLREASIEDGARSFTEVGALLNITAARATQIAKGAFGKVKAVTEGTAPASEAG